jgi:hypothetical protein
LNDGFGGGGVVFDIPVNGLLGGGFIFGEVEEYY